MSFTAWPEIHGFHNIRKLFQVHPNIEALTNGQKIVSYKAKPKIHGECHAVRCYPDGKIAAQSRGTDLTPTSDNRGFAKWVLANEVHWKKLSNVVVFGELAGPGVKKGVAISKIDHKIFAVFAAQVMGSDKLIIEPSELQALLGSIPDVYVLPWYSEEVLNIDWLAPDEELQAHTAKLNAWVATIEANDPWVESTFGVKGTGEGIVLYPVSPEHLGVESFGKLALKCKGEKHSVIKSANPAQVDPEVAASIDEFVEMVLTEARLEQGANAVGPSFDTKFIGPFLKWVNVDVEKETQDELEASGLTFQQVTKALGAKARNWYLEKVKALA